MIVPEGGAGFGNGPADERRPAASADAKSGERTAIRPGAVAQRAAHLEEGHARGKVVITMEPARRS